MPNDEIDVLNPPAFDEFRAHAADGPVQMLNLLDFKPNGGFERYAEYGAAVAPLLRRAGGHVVSAGASRGAMIGPSSWDLIAVVEYPTRQAFLDMVSSSEYQEIAHLRTEALERAELHPMDPVEAPEAG
ncbi:MAG: hypothetical protein QOI10_216 [Solirubrobacterales bacterium]|jgi:uncharacterized protein (DUF1330 family)|nr:hypothetical protein [Solirubrobacterales bacterium]